MSYLYKMNKSVGTQFEERILYFHPPSIYKFQLQSVRGLISSAISVELKQIA